MVKDQPALGVSSGGGPRPILLASHHAPAPRVQEDLVFAPVNQVGREGKPDVGARTARGNRPMNHRVAIAEAAGKDGRVLVLGRHDRAEPGEGDEVLRSGQRHQRSAVRVGRVGDDPLAAVLDPGQRGRLPRPTLLPSGLPDRRRNWAWRRSASSTRRRLLRATVRCECPRRSSTRTSKTVSLPN